MDLGSSVILIFFLDDLHQGEPCFARHLHHQSIRVPLSRLEGWKPKLFLVGADWGMLLLVLVLITGLVMLM